jgi:hypothetical protein
MFPRLIFSLRRFFAGRSSTSLLPLSSSSAAPVLTPGGSFFRVRGFGAKKGLLPKHPMRFSVRFFQNLAWILGFTLGILYMIWFFKHVFQNLIR